MYHHETAIDVMADDLRLGLLDVLTKTNVQPGPGGSRIIEASADLMALTRRAWQDFGPVTRFAVVLLWPSSQIVAHADAPIGTSVRFHTPLQTNAGCWSFSEGIWQQLDLGKTYRMDPTKPHGAVNWGDTLRLHLMIDVEASL